MPIYGQNVGNFKLLHQIINLAKVNA